MSGADGGESREHRLRRARWRASHRGTKELDLMLGRYAEAELAGMSDADLALFEQLLAMPDPELQAWLVNGADVGASELAGHIRRIRKLHGVT